MDYAKACYPSEGILLLKGKASKNEIVNEVEVPPLSVHGYGFSDFRPYMLPIDFSIVGTAHSHPSSVLRPSIMDLNNFYGGIMIITAYPYSSKQDIAMYDGKGNPMKYEIIEDR